MSVVRHEPIAQSHPAGECSLAKTMILGSIAAGMVFALTIPTQGATPPARASQPVTATSVAPQQDLQVVYSGLGIDCPFPLPADMTNRWLVKVDLLIRVPASWRNQLVTLRFEQPGNDYEGVARVLDSLEIDPVPHQIVNSAAEADALLPTFNKPATVTVTSEDGSQSLSVEVTSWTVRPRHEFRDVTMVKRRGRIIFTGRLMTVAGKPARRVTVVAQQFEPYLASNITGPDMPVTNKRGAFKVVGYPAKPGLVGVGVVPGPRAFGNDRVYSQTFRYR